MLKIKFLSTEQNIAAMKAKGPAIVESIFESVTKSMFRLQSFIQSGPLSGGVLNVRTGKLRGSINTRGAEISGTKISGFVEGAGSVAFYGRFAEEGIPHSWEIRASKARFLSFLSHGKQVFAKSVSHPPLPKRSFMASSLQAMAPEITADLHVAVDKAVQE